MKNQGMTVIVGGTGKTGRRVEKRLIERKVPCRVTSRAKTPAFDWNDESTWAANVLGADRVYLTYYPDLAVPGASTAIQRFTEVAVESGVQKIVLLSGRGEPQVLPSEQAVRDSGVSFTILRCAFFYQNFSEGPMLGPILEGEFAFPAGSVADPFTDAEDIADVAVAALLDDKHAGKIYELSGPRLITFDDAMREISAATGRTIRYVPVSKAEYAAALAPHLPPDVVTFLSDLFEQIFDGHNAYVSDGVERALGRPARDFRDFARETAAAGVWNVG